MRVVVKVGSSSLTNTEGNLDDDSVIRVAKGVELVRDLGHEVVLVTSAAVAAGMPPLEIQPAQRPTDTAVLQAIAAVGQVRLMAKYDEAFQDSVVLAQVLVTADDFMDRNRYLNARGTLERLLGLGVLPIVNENDTIADAEIRFGDNDRIAALVALSLKADLLVLLTDTDGVLTEDPAKSQDASLIAEIQEIDRELEAIGGGSSTPLGSGGMASKLAAAKMASWSGVKTVIAGAHQADVLANAITDNPSGTIVRAKSARLSAKKVWIAFAVRSHGKVAVDGGAVAAVVERKTSLLPAGVVAVSGEFQRGNAVEVCGPDGVTFAKGLSALSSTELTAAAGKSSSQLADDSPRVAVHRDDLVVVPG